jgi:serine-type D-Ala-D-Ala carboxypeptidase/endopeptidase (penicillin-binding protein 4)
VALGLILCLASCEGSPTLPAQVQAAGGPKVGANPSKASARCRRLARLRDHLAHRPAAWKSAIDSLARGHSVGIAVGVRGTVLYEHEARRRRTPASNEKLMLSMALYDRLGPSFRIRTRAMARRVEKGVVKGDLWIVGGGDPSLTKKQTHFWGPLSSPTLQQLAAQIRSAGIEHITGGVTGGSDYFVHDFNAPGWEPYVPNEYVELATALVVNGNFHVKDRPEVAAARALLDQLTTDGVEVDGSAGAGKPPQGLHRIAQLRSPPLKELVAYMDAASNNFYAEMLGKLLGAKTYGAPGTIRKGARAIAAWTKRHGVEITARDSSGLSYQDKVSPRGLVRLMGVAEQLPWGVRLRNSLPTPGEGTLQGRLAGLDVHAKTGTLFNSDSALSGWVRRNDRAPWVEFSILDQNMPKAVEDKIVGVIARAPIVVPRAVERAAGGC